MGFDGCNFSNKSYGSFFDDTPMAWQEIAGKRETISLKYALENKNPSNPQDVCIYGFSVGKYDKNETLILDPAVIVYCGYIGGSGSDPCFGIAVDGSGCAYITGATSSTEATFPVTVGPDLTNGDNTDAFVAKISADGAYLVYCGYIGGSINDFGYEIAVDSLGCAYVTGLTSSTGTTSFPVTVGPDLTHNGGNDAFVAKVKADGTALDYCGYIGGSGYDVGHGIAVDGSGCAYITGLTESNETTFPVAVGPDLTHNGLRDAFVAKVNATGTGLVYCWYIGGSGWDEGYGIAVDASDCAYVAGHTTSTETTFPVTGGPDLTHNGGNYEAFVAKVMDDGTDLVYCGYIGGSSYEYGKRIAVDGSGCAYVTGWTDSDQTTFPVTGGPDLTHNGDVDVFVAKVKADGIALDYCGYIGGANSDFGFGIAIDAAGCAYITGATHSDQTTFPVIEWPDLTHNGLMDAFVARVKPDGTAFDYCGYAGGSGNEYGQGIVVDGSGCAYIIEYTESDHTTFPVTVGPDLTHNGGNDAFVAKISWTNPVYTVNFAAGNGGTLTGDTTQTVISGGNCTLVEAVPNSGYQFVDWTGTNGFVTTTDNPLTVTNVTADMTITANFAINTYTVTFAPGSNGTLTGLTPQAVNYGNNCTAVEAVPNTGYQFVNWTGTGGFITTTANPLTVANVTANMTITANFALNPPFPIQLGAWSTTTPFNTPRHAHTSVAYNGYLYVLGGCDANDTRYNDVQYAPINADGSLGTWQAATPFNPGRRSHASVAYNGYLYVMGGTPSGGVYLTMCNLPRSTLTEAWVPGRTPPRSTPAGLFSPVWYTTAISM